MNHLCTRVTKIIKSTKDHYEGLKIKSTGSFLCNLFSNSLVCMYRANVKTFQTENMFMYHTQNFKNTLLLVTLLITKASDFDIMNKPRSQFQKRNEINDNRELWEAGLSDNWSEARPN